MSVKKLRVFEAFAGIGSQKRALSNAIKNKDYEIVGSAEWYVPAIVMYETIHNNFSLSNIEKEKSKSEMQEYLQSKTLSWDSKNPILDKFWKSKSKDFLRIAYTAVMQSEKSGNIFDIKNLHKRTLKNIDLLTYSFPCQDLSQQGIQKGMSKNSGTRSGLLWEIERALETSRECLPKYLLMENVPALTHKNHAEDLQEWLSKLESLGYQNSLKILNSSDFGSAQARRRVFMLSTLNGFVELPQKKEKIENKKLKDILNEHIDDKYYMPALYKYDLTNFSQTKSNIKKAALKDYSSFNSETYVYDPAHFGPTLTASGANSRIKIKTNIKNKPIRRMNPEEAFKYMGFTSEDHNKITKLNLFNENQLIFVCGNSISVEVLESIMEGICGHFYETRKSKL